MTINHSQDEIAFDALQKAAESITSDLNLTNVLANLGAQINRLIGCDAWSVSDYVESMDALVTMADFGPEQWHYTGEGAEIFYLQSNPTTASVIRERKVVHYTANDPDLDEEELQFIREYGHSSMLMLPMIYQDKVLGMVEFANFGAPIHFSDFEIRIGQLIANQGAIAISHARMFAQQSLQLEEMAKLREQAEIADNAKGVFLANMSHEFRTPLNVIIGFSEYLKDIIEDPEGNREELLVSMQSIIRSGRHLEGIVNDILDVSSLESGSVDLTISRFLAAPLLEDVESIMRFLADENGVKLLFESDPSIGYITSDRQKLIQILMNLVGNGIKFSPRGTVRVKLRHNPKTPGYVQFLVSDTGIGIPADKIDQLFKPFSQINDDYAGMTKGTGLGLSLSKGYALLMGGDITVQSAYEAGSTFTLELPIHLEVEEKCASQLSKSFLDSNEKERPKPSSV